MTTKIYDDETGLEVPVIPNIHAAVLRASEQQGALDMAVWHTCETTHCRAGWVIVLAGKRGRALEAATTTRLAAVMIYAASSEVDVSSERFFDSEEDALDDMRRCAAEEAALSK